MPSLPTVETPYGVIEEGDEAEIYLGIPYAKPPIGELRFENPQPPTKWKTPLKADKFGAPAITSPERKFKDGDEDCLTLNLFKPKKTDDEFGHLPVMVYIHGGGFVAGSSREWGYKEACRKLVSHGVIVVTVNYRLGPIGFFTTSDGNLPGNYGIWDMIQALKFLQEILPSFNGDPKNVTLFGHSAGGMATSLLTLTNETKNLFARALPMSGSALSKSSNNPFLIKHSKMVAEALGIDFSSYRLRDEIIEVTAEQIKEAVKSLIPEMLRVDEVVLVHFSPRMDGILFKEISAVELVYKSDVTKPLLMGLVDQEAILFVLISVQINVRPGVTIEGINYKKQSGSEMSSLPLVETVYGIIEGINHVTPEGFEAEIFLGIPFAKSPIGELRFENPQPPTKWKTPLKADKFGAPAITFPERKFKDGEEDCLTLNLFKPKKTDDEFGHLPVMVYIHGGGFVAGSSREWGYKEACRKLVSHGVIVVTVNYRLGPIGFFTTGDGNLPGNYGIWDMIQALKFLQQILPSFNGDPTNVTIFGHSAGGMATSLLTLTDETKDLFARAIPMSGSALSKSSNNPFLIKHSKMVAEALGIDFASYRLRDEIIEVSAEQIKEAVKSLSLGIDFASYRLRDEIIEVTAEQIKEAVKSLIPEMLRVDEVVLVHFSPRIDGILFKEKTAAELVYKCDVTKPILMGLVDQEAILFAVNPFGKIATSGKYIWIHPNDIPNVDKSRFSDYVIHKLADKAIFGSAAKDYADAVINFYETTVKTAKNRYLTMLTQLISDVNFNIPALREARARAAAGQKVYFYLYTYVNPKYKSEYFDGVAHADELPNFFDAPVGKPNVELEGEEGEVQKKFAELFVNFSKNGKAETHGLQVPLVTPEKIPHIKIDKELSIEDNLWPERINFWNTLAEDFGFDWPSGISTANPGKNVLTDIDQ